jgi:predicted phosphodiesterase
LVAPFVLQQLGEGLSGQPLHVVWGNNDGDTFRLTKVASRFPSIQLHGELADVPVGDFRMAVTHYPEVAHGLARSGSFGLVAYGHDHVAHEEWIGGCLLLNPGEVMGMKGRSSLAMVETADRSVQWVDL